MSPKDNHFNVSAFWHTQSHVRQFFSHICAPLSLTTKSAVSSQSIAQDVHSMYQVNLRGHNYYNHANFTSNGISSDRLSLQVYHKVLPQLRSSLYNYYFQKSTFIDSECTNQCLTISCLSARHFWSCWLNPAAAECSVLMKVGRFELVKTFMQYDGKLVLGSSKYDSTKSNPSSSNVLCGKITILEL